MGQMLDVYQKAALQIAFAVDPHGVLTCFEFAIILSRQDGKGEVLIALELAWLFLFNEPLISHSAHLYPTAREHFMKLLVIIQTNPDLERRIKQIREGKGDEEVILKTGGRLKFFSRKGGAGLGFTGSKLVCDESMDLDAVAMGVGLPTMATKRNAQVIYAASAGHKDSSQLAAVRQRGLDQDPAVGLMMWEAERPVYDEYGQLVDGDDPEDPATWARTNPAMNRPVNGITEGYIRKEARTLGGFRAPEWWRQRLGVGDYPAAEAAWKVIAKPVWEAQCDEQSSLLKVGRCLAIDADEETGVYTLGIGGRRGDGRGHVELVDRRRGAHWVLARCEDIRVRRGGGRRYPVALLKTSIAAHLGTDLVQAGWRVCYPNGIEYDAGCQALVKDLEANLLVHYGQEAMTRAGGHGSPHKTGKGSWRWDRSQPHQSSIIVATLLWWLIKSGKARIPKSRIW